MKASSKASRIVISLCEIVVGILLLVNPVGFTTGIITFLGIVLLIMGIASVIQYFRTGPERAALEHGLTRGLIQTLFGVFCIAKSGWFIATFPLLTVIYGIGTLILGIAKVEWTVDMIRLKIKKWIWALISAILTVACAAVILYNPFGSTAVLWVFIAVTLIVEAIVDIIVTIFAGAGKKVSE